MAGEKIKQRDSYVDILRGIAMLLVVLGHTMTGSTIESEKLFVFNVVWSLQMPMFILISGFVTRYSREVMTLIDLFTFVKKRTISYLLPWLIWTIAIRGMMFGHTNSMRPRYILWHMDSGYWFLFTIWTISIIFGISRFLSYKISKKTIAIKNLLFTTLFYLVGMLGLVGLASMFGLAFLGIKLTLYYMVFFYIGYLFGSFRDSMVRIKNSQQIEDVVIAVSTLIWVVILLRVDLYNISDNAFGIGFRAFSSIAGCIAVCGLLKPFFTRNNLSLIGKGFEWIGRNSLEVYVLHVFLLSLLKFEVVPNASTLPGVMLILINYMFTLLLVYVLIKVLQSNRYLRKFLFGK